MPPGLEELATAAEFERRVQSGGLFRSLLGARTLGPQTSVTLASPEALSEGTAQPAPPLTLRLSDELYLHWRSIEAAFHAIAGRQCSFVASCA